MIKENAKRIVFYNPFAAWPSHFETDLELIRLHVEKGDEVIVLVCNRDLEVCEPNNTHNYFECHACMTRRKNGFRMLGLTDKVSFRSLRNLQEADLKIIDQYQNLDLKTIEDIKAVTYEQCDIGMAVAASLIDYLREAEPDIPKYMVYINKAMKVALTVYFSMRNNLKELKPDEVYIFNGRFAALRPALRAAQELNINVKVHERAGVLGKYTIMHGTYPHDLEKMKEIITEVWNGSPLGLAEKIKIGAQWYDDCRYSGRTKVLLKDKVQQEDILPQDFDPNKFNVVIFSSSEEEFASISGYLSRFYKDQNEGVQKIVEDLRSLANMHVYLRVHPNLKGILNSQTKYINSVKNTYPHFTVVDAESKVSSYKLMDSSDIVIVFASTMGLEAAYAGKMCLLVRRTQWEDLGACTRINSHEELIKIIKESYAHPNQKVDWEARKLAAIKYGFFTNTYGIPFQYFQHHSVHNLTYKGKSITPDFWFIRRVISRLNQSYQGSLKKLV